MSRLKILILVNLEINRKKQTVYINYQPQHMSFHSREKHSYLKRSVRLPLVYSYYRSSQLFRHTSLLTLAGERAARVLLTISP